MHNEASAKTEPKKTANPALTFLAIEKGRCPGPPPGTKPGELCPNCGVVVGDCLIYN